MNLELVGALNELEKERGISKAVLFEAIEAAIVSAYKRNYGSAQNVRVELSGRGEIKVFARKDVVEEVLDEANEIALEDAKKLDLNYELDDVVEIEVTPKNFGRIAAQTAKQVVIQRIREAERSMVFEEYQNREGDIVTGIVQRTEHRNVLVDLGKVEALLPPSEQIPRESYAHGARMKVYITEVRKTTKGPQVVVSRTHPGLLKRLFELEVPEIHDGIVEVKSVAREAGNRSKIAVFSANPNVDPVGACVGPRGMRVQAVVQELKGEKVDIVQWDQDPEVLIANSLSPARVLRVYITEDEKSARAVVPDHHLSLAIGKEGQNARLAARLCGWKIDIKSESQMQELLSLEAKRLFAVPGERREAPDPEIPDLTQPGVDLFDGKVGSRDEAEKVEETVDETVEEVFEDLGDLEPDFEPDVEDEIDVDVEEEPEAIQPEPKRDERQAPPVAKAKKDRTPRTQDIKGMLHEAEEESEDLPTLFSPAEGGETEGEEGKPGTDKRRVKRSDPAYFAAPPSEPKPGGKKQKKESGKRKEVIKDLSELAKLMDELKEDN